MKALRYIIVTAFVLLIIIFGTRAQTSNLALNFDGVNDRVTIPHNAAYNIGNGNFTVEAWVKLPTTQNVNFPTIISKRDAGVASSGFMIMVYQGKVFVQLDGNNLLQGATTIQDNTCHHIAVVRSSGTLTCYVDGVADGSVTGATHVITTSSPFWVGHDVFSQSTTNFKGTINELRLWNIARTQTQIQANRNLYLVGVQQGLVGCWRMNEGSSQTVIDYSTFTNNGILGSTVSTETIDPVYVTGCLIACIPPSAGITSNGTTVCNGGALVLNATTGTGYTYQWSLNGNVISGATNSTYTANAPGTYSVVITANGCSATATKVITSGVSPWAAILYAGSNFICSGSSKIISVNNLQNTGSNPTFQWTNNGVNIPGATNDSITVSAAGVYACIVTNSQTGCNFTTANATITLLTGLPAPVISAPNGATKCNSVSLQITVPTGGNSYQWKLNNVNISGATAYTYNATQSGTYRCLVTNDCGSQTSTSIPVVITGGGPISTSGNTTFCSGSINLTATFISGASYQWYNSNIIIPGATFQTYTATGHGVYKCMYTTPGCGQVLSSNFIAVNGPATINANGGTTFCTPGSTALIANAALPATYQWKRNGTNISGATSVAFQPTLSGSYTCQVVNSQCGTTLSNAINITVGVVTPISVTPAAVDICDFGFSPQLVASPQMSGTYNWYHVSSGAGGGPFLIWTDSTSNVLPAYSIFSTNVYAELVTACGTSTSNVVMIRNFQAAHIEVTSPNPSCTGVTLIMGPLNFGVPYTYWNTYQWKKNGVNIAGANNYEYYATSSGTYTCEISASCGTYLVDDQTVVTINSAQAAITPSGTYNFCAGTSVTMVATPGGSAYVWKKYGNIIQGATSSSYNTSDAGVYKVNITFPCGTVVSQATTLVKISNPAASFTANGPTTFCAGQSVTFTANTFTGVTYQWEKNNNPINGATSQSYIATTAGNYRVRETAFGCSKLSPKTTVSVPCRIGNFDAVDEFEAMTIIPNPFSVSATLELPVSTDLSSVTVCIYDITGKEVRKYGQISSSPIVIDRDELQPGIYMVRMVSSTTSDTRRFIIE